MLGYEPLSGAMDGWIPIHVGPRPYAMLCCPYRASITPKGCYNTARGLVPGYTNVYKIKNAPVGGSYSLYAPYRGIILSVPDIRRVDRIDSQGQAPGLGY